jgi:hypothetical protein
VSKEELPHSSHTTHPPEFYEFEHNKMEMTFFSKESAPNLQSGHELSFLKSLEQIVVGHSAG